MELTHKYIRKGSLLRFRSVLKQQLARFINDNPDVFEAISRTGAPFGGNSLPRAGRRTTNHQATPRTKTELDLLRQQVNALTQQVAQLHQTLHETEAAIQHRSAQPNRKATAAAGKQIGIYRFWALQGKAPLMA